MDSELKKIREIRTRILGIEIGRLSEHVQSMPPPIKALEYLGRDKERARLLEVLDSYETRYLIRKAESWGIEVPYKPEWYVMTIQDPNDPSTGEDVFLDRLNSLGKAVITKQIRDARFARMKDVVGVLVPVLALIVAILALFKDIIVQVLKQP
jgi:hypothetical protein